MDKDFSKVFNSCPACGSTERFLESLANELKERGIARKEWNITFDHREGAVVDPAKEAAIPIGSEVPIYVIDTDICLNCGCVYAIRLGRGMARKTIPPALPKDLPLAPFSLS